MQDKISLPDLVAALLRTDSLGPCCESCRVMLDDGKVMTFNFESGYFVLTAAQADNGQVMRFLKDLQLFQNHESKTAPRTGSLSHQMPAR